MLPPRDKPKDVVDMDSREPGFHSDEVYYFNTHRPLRLVKDLENRYANFPVEKIYEIFRDVLELEVTSVRPDANFGTGHVIYFVETNEGVKVFRANIGVEVREHYMSLETEFIRLYEGAGIPVGKIIYADATRKTYTDFDFQILELLPGKDLETEWSGTEEEYAEICKEMGRIAARQYRCPVEGFGRFKDQDKLEGSYKNTYEYLTAYLDYDLSVLVQNRIVDEQMLERIKKVFEDSKNIFDKMSQAYLVHHDMADHNLRYTGSKILALFDWENAVAFDPICELASAHTWVSHFPFKREKMIEGFVEELGGVPEDMHEKISIYFLRTMIWKICFALRRGKFTERHKKLFDQALFENSLS